MTIAYTPTYNNVWYSNTVYDPYVTTWYSNPNTVYDLHVTSTLTSNYTWEPIHVTGTFPITTTLFPESYSYSPWAPIPISKQDMEKARLKSNLIIQIKSRASSIEKYPGESEPERRALDTLREVISEEEFRKYLRYGFILVKGKSGATYQIFRNASHCKVWLNGQIIEEVCVRIKDEQVPKTDKIIAFKTIIETSEEQFKRLGNVYKMTKAA